MPSTEAAVQIVNGVPGSRRVTHLTIKRTIAWPAKCRKAQPPWEEDPPIDMS